MQFGLSKKIFILFIGATVLVMSTFMGLRYYLVFSHFLLESEQRAFEVAERVAESVTPSIWSIHQKTFDERYSTEVASVIFDAEMASDLVVAVSVYGNFGHLYMGRYKLSSGELVALDPKRSAELSKLHQYRIRQPIRHGSMTIGSVEVVYKPQSGVTAIYSGLQLELLQVGVISLLFVLLLYWALRKSLILPIRSLQVAHQTLDSITEGVVMTDSDFKIVQCNVAYETLTGFCKSDLIGLRPKMKLADRNVSETLWQQLKANCQWSGEVVVRRREKLSFPARLSFNEVWHKGDLVCHVAVITDISVQKESEQKLERIAYYDSLTSLPNRTYFHKTLEQEIQLAKRHRRSLGVLFVDLDNFKWINDQYGHGVGDRYLESVAKRLKKRVRNTDFLFRLGGDEFTAIATGVCDEESLEILARDLIRLAAEPVLIDGDKVFAGASIGIALFPRDAGNAEQLIQRADAAMYQAKDEGGNHLVFFSLELETRRKNNRNLEEALRRGLVRDELIVYYQPKIHYQTSQKGGEQTLKGNIMGSRVQGAEALLRWSRPGNGIVNPFEFIPVAEQSDLIVDIGHWVIRAACAQLDRWRHTPLEDLTVAVNISPRQLKRDDFVQRLGDTIQEFGVNPALLELEVTESAVIENIEQSVDILNQLKQLGVTIAMDDFGTGFSSLSYLKQLPIDVIKIDRSFVNDLPNDGDDVVIVNAIFSIARAMNIRVVAEGIENYAQLQFLLGQGCECSQGYFHSRPLPAADFERWVGLFRVRIETALTESTRNHLSGKAGISPALTGGS